VKLRHLFLAFLFVCFAVVTARADEVPGDGRIIVGHGSDPGGPDSCGLTFKIKLNGNGGPNGTSGGIKNCTNTSGFDWTGLEIFATIPLGATLTCITSSNPAVAAFSSSNCGPTPLITSTFDHKENVEIILTGGDIAAGSQFFINLNTSGSSDTNDAGGWFSFEGGNLDAVALTPEPGSVLLLASGLVLVTFRRRRTP